MLMNAATAMVTRHGKFEHITPVLHHVLHWRPVPHRIVEDRIPCPSAVSEAPVWHTFSTSTATLSGRVGVRSGDFAVGLYGAALAI